jgi:hypothetical protein
VTGIRQAAADYLAMRRALGFSLLRDGRWLMNFIDYLEQQGAAHITTELAVAWAVRTRPGVNLPPAVSVLGRAGVAAEGRRIT